MKTILLTTAALGLLVGTAFAAPGGPDNHAQPTATASGPMMAANSADDKKKRENQQIRDRQQNANQNIRENQQDANQKIRDNQQQANQRLRDQQQNANQKIRDNKQDANQQIRDKQQDNNNRPGYGNNNNRPHVDVSKYRRNVTAPRRFHAQAYRGPSGYHYQRWTYGQRLPSAYWARNYWLTDFLSFGLMSPPDGYTWVRYGSDALLIDEYTGDIIQVEYNVFY